MYRIPPWTRDFPVEGWIKVGMSRDGREGGIMLLLSRKGRKQWRINGWIDERANEAMNKKMYG